MGYRYSKFSSIGKNRSFNEDAIDITEVDDGLLFILCDGMGAELAAESASTLAVKFIRSYFESENGGNYLDNLNHSIIEANDFIYNHSNSNSGRSRSATTVELLYLKENFAYIAHVGDSRIYLHKNGRLKQLTKDHSLVQKLVDEGFLTINQAENHPEKNVVLKAIGEKGLIDSDLMKLKLNEYDINKFFICSDGVTSVLSNDEISDILTFTDSDKIIDTLSQLIKSRNVLDDFSFIYIENER